MNLPQSFAATLMADFASARPLAAILMADYDRMAIEAAAEGYKAGRLLLSASLNPHSEDEPAAEIWERARHRGLQAALFGSRA